MTEYLAATCDAHGAQRFVYSLPYDWWECPLAGCSSVAPAERVTQSKPFFVTRWRS